MKTKPTIKITIRKEDKGYSAYALIADKSINTFADSNTKLKTMIADAVNLAFEDEGWIYSPKEIQFEYDLKIYLSFYKVLDTEELSKRTGVDQTSLTGFFKGAKKPTVRQTQRIVKAAQQIGKELSEITLF